MAIRECDCKEFQDSGHTDECNDHYRPKKDMSIGDAVALLKSKGYTLQEILEAGAELRRREQVRTRDSGVDNG